MNRWIRNLGVGSMIVAVAFTTFSGESHANSTEDEVQHASEAYEKMDAQSQQQFMAGFQANSMNISSMDIETALMAVQNERVRLLEAQLQDQIMEVQKRNKLVSELNEKLTAVKVNLAELKNAKGPEDKIRELEETIDQLKREVDAASNSQQMDMLRLQSLSQKRNEAFDTMTNFIKKMQESRASIIGNMR